MSKTKKGMSTFLKATTKPKKVKLPDVVEIENPQPVEVVSDEDLADLLATVKETPAPTTLATVVEAVKEAVVNTMVKPGAVVDSPEKVFKAYGVFWDSTNKIFVKATIDYDPVSGYTKLVGTEKIADSPATAIYKLNNLYSLKIIKREESV